MKILSLHCDYIKFKPLKKALKNPQEISKEDEKGHEVKEPLVILTAVEKSDESNKNIISEYVKNVKELASQVKAENIVLYPYAHLSSSLSNPDFALKVLEDAEKELNKEFRDGNSLSLKLGDKKETTNLSKKEKFKVVRAPFGYYKEFELKCKGHPLSELSRVIGTSEMKEVKSVGGKVVSKEEEVDVAELVKRLTKVKMSADRNKDGLKSNVELGRDLDLYVVNEVVGSGLPLFTPRGTTIKRELERFIVDEELKRDYQYTSTPIMAKSDLYKISGHWQHYQDSMFILQVGNETFALRPMTCPFQFVIYKSKPRSYKELPIKYAEISNLFRNEKSGELMGLTRLRQFTLADAHILCTPKQLEDEFKKVIDLINYVTKTLKIEGLWYRFSKWDPKNKEKYVDNPKAWEETQRSMKNILDKLKIKYVEAENEAAFYGPKLDIQYKNIFGKEDTLITVQIDFALPEKFDLTYVDENNEKKRPMIIHRSSIGCLERTMAYLLEKTQGNLPTWLSPTQVRVITFTDRNLKAAEKVFAKLRETGIRVDSDFGATTVNDKVRSAELMKIPYLITIGDKEEEKGTIALKKRGMNEKPKFGVKLDDFLKEILEEIRERK